MVWDRIVPYGGAHVTEGWGGIGYGLAAAAAAAGEGWRIRPLVRVGGDVFRDALDFFESLGVETGGVVETAEANNRVLLFYSSEDERTEQLTGGVRGWRQDELLPRLEGLDALLINFVSGFELSLDLLQSVRESFTGPIHGDLHSLFLGVAADGTRVPRALPGLTDWLACFDTVQVNEREAALMAGVDPRRLASVSESEAALCVDAAIDLILDAGCRAALVTLGSAGARWAVADGVDPGSALLDARAHLARGSVTIQAVRGGDPTGCGDVWGGTFFPRLLDGDTVPDAARAACRAAGRKVGHVTTNGLYEHLLNEGEC